MSTLAKMGRALLSGSGLALVASLALTNGCASEDAAGAPRPADRPSIAFFSDAAASDGLSTNSAPIGIFTCILEGGDLGSIVVFQGPLMHNPCAITATPLAGSSKMFCNEDVCPTCQELQTKWNCPLV